MATKQVRSNLIEFNLKTLGGIYRIFWIKEQLGAHPGIRRGFYGDSRGMHTTFYEQGGMHHEVGGEVFFKGASPTFINIQEAWQLGYSTMPTDSLLANPKLASRVENVPHENPNRIVTLDYGDYTTSLDTSIHMVRANSLQSFLKTMLDDPNGIMLGKGLSRLASIEIVRLKCFDDFKLVIILLSGK